MRCHAPSEWRSTPATMLLRCHQFWLNPTPQHRPAVGFTSPQPFTLRQISCRKALHRPNHGLLPPCDDAASRAALASACAATAATPPRTPATASGVARHFQEGRGSYARVRRRRMKFEPNIPILVLIYIIQRVRTKFGVLKPNRSPKIHHLLELIL